MTNCIICHFATELDDVVISASGGRCVCLRCYARETDTARPMPKKLQRELSSFLADVEVA